MEDLCIISVVDEYADAYDLIFAQTEQVSIRQRKPYLRQNYQHGILVKSWDKLYHFSAKEALNGTHSTQSERKTKHFNPPTCILQHNARIARIGEGIGKPSRFLFSKSNKNVLGTVILKSKKRTCSPLCALAVYCRQDCFT